MCLSVLDTTFLRLKLLVGTGRWGRTDKRLCYNTLYYFSLSFNYHDRKDSDEFFFEWFYHIHSVMAVVMMIMPYPGIRDGTHVACYPRL